MLVPDLADELNSGQSIDHKIDSILNSVNEN